MHNLFEMTINQKILIVSDYLKSIHHNDNLSIDDIMLELCQSIDAIKEIISDCKDCR